ncbi:hypothetical protein [Pseudoduganella namucuonensis]|uniref:Uncharacterized protein n=1 Tax=Pseudoduganella namucuonensis TaxID=1035707 RepID=A0A1I7K1S8_9BURK|nr:hypothetical protein [Pseudoduganella namucuonensis]SFU91367.1 hypothetical protein SAMN05216552_101480 [Pseudoduganella namucuonensis]
MKKILGMIVLATASLASGLAGAHGSPVANHGGMVQAVGETWLELVVKGDKVELYVQDDGDDMPAADMGGKVTIVKGAAKSEFALKPAGGNKLEAQAPGAVKGSKVLAVLILADKKTKVSAGFDIK